MTDDYGPTDLLYYAIARLKGWDELLGDARVLGSRNEHEVGRLLSGIILAVGEDKPVIAVSGSLDDTADGMGHLLVVFDTGIAYVDVRSSGNSGLDYEISVHTFSEVEALKVRSGHNYFDDTKAYPRHSGIEVSFSLAGKSITLTSPRSYSKPITDAESIWRAFTLIRQSRQ